MKLQLSKPIAIIDLETTGVNVGTDKIIEIAIVKFLPGSNQPLKKRKLINPGRPIPEAASAVHGITDDMVKDAPTFDKVADELRQFLDNCDLAGYNSNRFDIPMLMEEFMRIRLDFFKTDGRKLLDVQKIFHMMEQRTLSAAYKFYCDKNLDNAHSAEADVDATWEVLLAQIERYPQMGDTVDSILKFIGDEEIVDFARRFVMENGVEVFNFGKHKGKPVADVLRDEPSYYDWMMKGDFPLHTKSKLTEIYMRSKLKK
ncbi:MAG: 3'-5' exonuclease [Sediminibacterium sp.]|jgi:DNA polymerase-3 subunit epsilon|nr:3'-5' exonuclease [Sediminibacterium sp.]